MIQLKLPLNLKNALSHFPMATKFCTMAHRTVSALLFYWSTPQQMLRTHRSLEGLLCNPVRRMKMMRSFLLFHFNGMKLTEENRSTRRKTCPSATLSTTNPTWTDPGSNPDLRSDRPATNRLSHGTAFRPLTYENVYQFTFTEQKAPDNSEVHSSS
jgi:hypothetical protein